MGTSDVNKHIPQKRFWVFLDEHNLWHKYVDNIIDHSDRLNIISWVKLEKMFLSPGIKAISGAFSWPHTPEGREYWSRVNVKWIKFFHNEMPDDPDG